MTILLVALTLQNASVVREPNGYTANRKWPLLILLHGNGDKAENFIRNYEFPEARNRFVLVSINSKTGSWDGAEMGGIVDAVLQSHCCFLPIPYLGGSAPVSMIGCVARLRNRIANAAEIVGLGS
jgi:hypothetical protein